MEISEDWVRGLTGWKPFKEGKAMADQGLVAGFKSTGTIQQGIIREGRVNLRPTVKIAGSSDVRVQCGCAEHRATGGVCAHAVAVLLCGLHAPAPASKAPATRESGPPRAWDLRFSPRLEDELADAKLSVRLLRSAGAITANDIALTSWLEDRRLETGAAAIALRLAGSDTGELLDLAAGHPRIEIDGRPDRFRLEPDPAPPLRLRDSRLEGRTVILELSADETRRRLVRWGDSAAVVGPAGASRLPAVSTRAGWFEGAAELAKNGRLKLSVDSFLGDFDAWLDLLEPPQPGWLGSLRLAGAEPDFELELEGSLGSLDAVLKVRYPGLPARPLPEPGEPFPQLPGLADDGHLLVRNPAAEDRARARLIAIGFQPASARARLRLTGQELVLGFIADDLPSLKTRWLVREGERFSVVAERVHVVRPAIRELAGHGSSLSFELSFQTTDGKRIPSAEVRRILRGGKRRVKLSNGADLVVSRSCEELVSPLIEEMEIGRPDETIQLSGARAILFRNLREKLSYSLNESKVEDPITPEFPEVSRVGLNACLRSYQSFGSAWLVDRLQRLGGGLLADEMGLGKTIQTIAAINHFNQVSSGGRQPALVVAPTSLLGNWMAELERFAPGLKSMLFHGSGRDGLRQAIPEQDVVVTSYGTIVRDLAFHLRGEYRLVVADEASLLRNPDAEISKAMARLPAKWRVALTGTPVENRMQDLWSIFRFVAPGYLGNRADFKERYEISTAAGQASGGLLERLRMRISPFVLRRTKDQVAKDLPDKLEVDEWLDLTSGQADLYSGLARAGLEELERVRDEQGEGAGRMHLLTLLLRLRQVCVDPGLLELDEKEDWNAVKIERLLELLSVRFETSSKTLIFSQFAANLRRIEKRLEGDYGTVFRIDGTTRDRQSLVDRFQAEPGAAVFLISLKAGGYGLNLTAADAVVHMDPWWNPAVEAQATDRAHRIGQTRPVTVYRLLTRNTVEERVRRMQEQKRAVIEAATGDSETEVPAHWSGKDLEDLLR